MGDSRTRRAIAEDGLPIHCVESGTVVCLLLSPSFWVHGGDGRSECDDSFGHFAHVSFHFVCDFDDEKLTKERICLPTAIEVFIGGG